MRVRVRSGWVRVRVCGSGHSTLSVTLGQWNPAGHNTGPTLPSSHRFCKHHGSGSALAISSQRCSSTTPECEPAYGVPRYPIRLRLVVYTSCAWGSEGQAALRLRYVYSTQEADTNVFPIRTVRACAQCGGPGACVSAQGAHWAREARRARAAVERVAAGEALWAQVWNGTVHTRVGRCERDGREEREHLGSLPRLLHVQQRGGGKNASSTDLAPISLYILSLCILSVS